MVAVAWIYGAKCGWVEMDDEMVLLYSLVSVCAVFLDRLNLDEWDDPFYDELEDLIEKITHRVGEP